MSKRKAKPASDAAVLDWLLRHEASLDRYWFIGKPRWRVVVSTGHGMIASGETPHEAMCKAMETWGTDTEPAP